MRVRGFALGCCRAGFRASLLSRPGQTEPRIRPEMRAHFGTHALTLLLSEGGIQVEMNVILGRERKLHQARRSTRMSNLFGIWNTIKKHDYSLDTNTKIAYYSCRSREY